MTDGVKFIFKTLFKVPIFIFIAYFVFNIFAFANSYFKALGLSYVVMQTAVENNYIPASEEAALNEYCDALSTTMANNYQIIAKNADGYNQKQQYGKAFTAGVNYRYNVVWPLMPHEQREGYDEDTGEIGRVAGLTGNGDDFVSGAEMEDRREDSRHRLSFNITIDYTVPGLKYYADLAY